MNREELRAAILGADDLPKEIVDVPEWDQKVTMRGLTAAEKDAYVREITDMQSGTLKWKNASALLVVRTAVDESGERIFTDRDADALGDKSASAVTKLFNVAMRLSAFTDSDVEEMVGDFDAGQSGASSSS